MKYFFTLALVALGFAIGYFYKTNNFVETYSRPPEFSNTSNLSSNVITCQFTKYAIYEKDVGEDIVFKFVTEDPLIISFTQSGDRSVNIRSNNGNSEGIVLKDDSTVRTIAETNAFGDVFIYNIFKKERVVNYYKSYATFDQPFSYLSMGYCN